MPDFLAFLTYQFPRVNAVYLLALLGILVYWAARIHREARRGNVPRMAWWSLPGWLLLLYAPVTEQPTFFALGAFALLVAEFWRPYRRSRQRPGLLWPGAGLGLSFILLFSAAQQGTVPPLVMIVTLGLLLGSAAELLSALSWRDPNPVVRLPVLWPRWAKVSTPDAPDLSITLTGHGAELKNISRQALALSGWSPAQVNGWLLVRDPQGHPIQSLKVGETALLPLNETASGVRVWYSAAGRPDALLFKADWTPVRYQDQRVLN